MAESGARIKDTKKDEGQVVLGAPYNTRAQVSLWMSSIGYESVIRQSTCTYSVGYIYSN